MKYMSRNKMLQHDEMEFNWVKPKRRKYNGIYEMKCNKMQRIGMKLNNTRKLQ